MKEYSQLVYHINTKFVVSCFSKADETTCKSGKYAVNAHFKSYCNPITFIFFSFTMSMKICARLIQPVHYYRHGNMLWVSWWRHLLRQGGASPWRLRGTLLPERPCRSNPSSCRNTRFDWCKSLECLRTSPPGGGWIIKKKTLFVAK